MPRCTSFVRSYTLSRIYSDTIFVQTINNECQYLILHGCLGDKVYYLSVCCLNNKLKYL